MTTIKQTKKSPKATRRAVAKGTVNTYKRDMTSHLIVAAIGLFLAIMGYQSAAKQIPGNGELIINGVFLVFCAGGMVGASIAYAITLHKKYNG